MPPFGKEQTENLLAEINSETPPKDCVCRVKCVLVGDGAVGKTSLIVSYTTNGYPTEYVPTAFDNYSVLVMVDGHPIGLQLCDTAGQDDFDSLRPLCYPHTNVFLLCFSVVCPTSFLNISEKWLPEIRLHSPKAPVILVGTQSDLRNDVKILIELSKYHDQPVSEQTAQQLADRIGAVAYVECSSLTEKNLKEVFDTALLSALQMANPDLLLCNKSKNRLISKKLNLPDNHVDKISSKFLTNSDVIKKKKGWKRFCCLL